MTDRSAMSSTEKQSVASYLEVIGQAVEVGEYEVALTTIETLKGLIVDKLMIRFGGT